MPIKSQRAPFALQSHSTQLSMTHPDNFSSMPSSKIPAQEVWDNIAQNLSSLSALNASLIFHFRLRPAQHKHARVLDLIFRSQEWLDEAGRRHINPVLIGYDLEKCYHGSQRKGDKEDYLILQPGDMSGDFTTWCEELLQLFFSCLKPYNFDKVTKEVRLGCGLVVNVEAVLNNPEILMLPDLKKLFSTSSGHPEGSYLFWQHRNDTLGRLEYNEIAGINGKAKRLSQVDNICYLILSQSDMRAEHSSDYYFQKIGFNARSLRHIGATGKDGWWL